MDAEPWRTQQGETRIHDEQTHLFGVIVANRYDNVWGDNVMFGVIVANTYDNVCGEYKMFGVIVSNKVFGVNGASVRRTACVCLSGTRGKTTGSEWVPRDTLSLLPEAKPEFSLKGKPEEEEGRDDERARTTAKRIKLQELLQALRDRGHHA